MQNSDYVQAMTGLANSANFELAILLHDLTPYLFPQWFADGYSEPFVNNLRVVLEKADRIVVYSNSTKSDIETACLDMGIESVGIHKFRLADDIGLFDSSLSDSAKFLQDKFRGVSYILCTGAIHSRKNYELLYDVWHLLADKCGASCPHLVIVGGVAWNGGALARSIKLSKQVGRLIHILEDIDDAALDWLYRNCLLTVYPSLYEGWGLPVGESLAYGKICIASNRSSVPEIAPEITDLIDPLDRMAWLARILHYHGSASSRSAREEQIRSTYKSTTWSDSAAALEQASENQPQARSIVDTALVT